jgi:outer membrane protein assembly factor BamE (lipoprotein component of BamABCDE complex)
MKKILLVMLAIAFMTTSAFAWGEKKVDEEKVAAFLKKLDEITEANKNKWRKIEIGMTKSQVRAILGEPVSRNTTIGGEAWIYPKEGYVEFSKIPTTEDAYTKDGNFQRNYDEPRVSSFSEPTGFYY